MEEVRCSSCKRLLMKAMGLTPLCKIEVVCSRCGYLNILLGEPSIRSAALFPDGQGGYLTNPVG